MKITLAQKNPIVGDIEGNIKLLKDAVSEAAKAQSELVVLPELFLSGYPPRDLLERTEFTAQCASAVSSLLDFSKQVPKIGILFGTPMAHTDFPGTGFYNSALLIEDGKLLAQANKTLLPDYDIFEESRYFDSSRHFSVVNFRGEKLGISICEDGWSDKEFWDQLPYPTDPIQELANMGATLLINISASPYETGKEERRLDIIKKHAQKHQVPFLYCNQIGGNDELIFDGGSLAVNANGESLLSLPLFKEGVETIDLEAASPGNKHRAPAQKIASLHDALVLGIRDYVRKCGFTSALIGLSGGIDSAVTCALAVEALGKNNVVGITMPSKYSSEGSIQDSKRLAETLDIEFHNISIEEPFNSYLHLLKEPFAGLKPDITEENLQARIRGDILMAFSNKFGHLLLTTGNKSELAMGYCTLYGDMTGGLAVIADVLKTTVYELAKHINLHSEIIPHSTLTKPPSAELRPNQTDQDSLPPYEVLDPILKLYLEKGLSASKIVEQGYEKEVVYNIVRTVDRNEYKRRQAPPSLRVTLKAFGTGRRLPIAARYTHL